METTASRIIPLVADALGYDEQHDRAKIFREINECRELMFSGLGEHVREAFFLKSVCLPVQRFTQDCQKGCQQEYLGIAIPSEIRKFEVMRLNGMRVTAFSRHSGSLDQFDCRDQGRPLAMDLGRGWSLPADPPDRMNLGFRLRTERDCSGDDFRVGVSYYELNRRHVREDVKLGRNTHFTTNTVAALAMEGITLPPGRREIVEVWADDQMMAEFHPSVDVPNFRRYVLSNPVKCGAVVELHEALHSPTQVLYGTDPIETGDSNFWRNIIQWKELHYKTKRTASEERAYGTTTAFLREHAMSMLSLEESDTEIPVIRPDLYMNPAIRNVRALDRRSRFSMGRFR